MLFKVRGTTCLQGSQITQPPMNFTAFVEAQSKDKAGLKIAHYLNNAGYERTMARVITRIETGVIVRNIGYGENN